MHDLQGKVAVVTGGASGIGLAMVQRFAQEGMTAIAADVRLDAAQDAVADIDGAAAEQVDVTSYDSVAALAERVRDHHGAVHLLCNNAG
ncbi:MAG TPA: SDR family NAD(P)-dependent oxidoreductase, partial [Acidimicrobiia bacterium]|nr:SDR family NAD(P)-dependent oxidoreductase [Acidimicrobiia bacterium]